MANGDIIIMDQHRYAWKLLDAQSTSASSPWVECPAWFNIRSFWCDALETGATCDIMVSNALTQPASATDGPTAITQMTPTVLGGTTVHSYRWIKAKKVQGGTPAATTCIVECARNE